MIPNATPHQVFLAIGKLIDETITLMKKTSTKGNLENMTVFDTFFKKKT